MRNDESKISIVTWENKVMWYTLLDIFRPIFWAKNNTLRIALSKHGPSQK